MPGLAYAASKENNTKEGCERQLEKIKEASESAAHAFLLMKTTN